MGFQYLGGDGKAQSKVAFLIAGLIRAVKAFKDPFFLGIGYPDAVVCYGKACMMPVTGQGEPDLSAGRGTVMGESE